MCNKTATELPTSPDGCVTVSTLPCEIWYAILLITTAYWWCMTTLAVSDYPYLHDWGLVYWEATCLLWSPESCVTAARCSCSRMVHWKVKVTSSLADVWQQLFQQQYLTLIVLCSIHFHPCCTQTTPVHQRLETPTITTITEMQEHVYQKPARYVHEVKWHLIEIWSATSRASLINR